MPGSRALELFEEWKKNPNAKRLKSGPATPKELLDAHMEQIDKNMKELEERHG